MKSQNEILLDLPASTSMKDSKRWLMRDEYKVPYYLNGQRRQGRLDCDADISLLGTYEEAWEAVIAGPGSIVGVGFALGPDGTGNYWQGIDIDHVQINQFSSIAKWLTAGYIEISPSGKGIHAIGYGKHFKTLGSNGSRIEAYAEARYLTFTDKALRDESLTCLADFVALEVKPYHARKRVNTGVNQIAACTIVDPKIITELRSALLHLRADDYYLWIRMGIALSELGDVGRGLWLDWSATSKKFESKEAAEKWTTFSANQTDYRAVFAESQRQGWINPVSNAAQLHLAQPTSNETGAELVERLGVNWHEDEETEVPDLIDDLAADEEVTLLGGHGGIGKSFLALQMACAVAVGVEVLAHSARQARVLYYSAEDGRKRLTRRIRVIQRSFDLDASLLGKNLCIVDASDLEPLYGETTVKSDDGKRFAKILGPRADFVNLQRMVETFDAQLIVIDGASDTFDGNEIMRREVRAFVKLLRNIHANRKIGVLLLAHIDRSSARGFSSNDDGYAGSTAWHNSCRRRLFLQREVTRGKDEDGVSMVTSERFILRVMKNQDGQPIPDMELRRDESGLWHPAASIDLSATFNYRSDVSAVVAALIHGYYARGTYISASLAANASTGAYMTLKGDPSYPQGLDKKRLAEVIRNLERNGFLVKEQYPRANRGSAERWKVVRLPEVNPD